MKRARGLTMIELLVGLAVGSLVIVGAVFVYSQSRTNYSINEAVARLQENARYALAVMEPDLQLAGNYGVMNDPVKMYYHNGSTTYALDLDPTDPQLSPAPAAIHACGRNFAVNVMQPVEGTNGAYGMDATNCAPSLGAFIVGTDRLTIRRASSETVTGANAGRIQIYGDRLNWLNQRIFNDASATVPNTTSRELRNLIVRSYFITDRTSSTTVNVPTLWRKSLETSGGAPANVDEEILPGVEDMQVQFGIDTGDHDGVAGFDVNTDLEMNVPDNVNGVVSRWVDPGDVTLGPPPAGNRLQVVAVRVWLRIRAEQPEQGFNDTTTYSYGPITYTPTGADTSFRRIVVSRTVFLRNARFL